ncbi:DUF2934 domain-containing protein [Azospirillum sp. A29]
MTTVPCGKRSLWVRTLRAYQIWQEESRPEGRQEEYWLRARELIEA